MAINPLSSALTGANLPDPAPTPKQQTPPQPPPTLLQLENNAAATLDPLLLEDLSALDAASAAAGQATPAATEDASLNQQLTSFFMQQATGFYTASQQMDGIDPGSLPSGALGNTTA